MKCSVKLLMLFALLIAIAQTRGFAADVCVPRTLKIKALRGVVMFVANSKGQEPVSNAKLELRVIEYPNDEYTQRTIMTVMADENGHFAVGHVKSGKYLLYVESPEGVLRSDFIFPIKLEDAQKRKESDPELKITLGLPFMEGSCHGSYAEYGRKQT